MKRWVIALVVAGVSAGVAASNVHLKGGANAKPTFVDLGVTLSAAGALAGLGNGDVIVTLIAQADVTSTCTNQGGNAAPGQNPAPIVVLGSLEIPENEIKNGTTPFNVETEAPATVIPGAPDCPNTNWTEAITDLAFTNAVLAVQQPAGTLVFTLSCTFSPATTDGLVPRANVTCQ